MTDTFHGRRTALRAIAGLAAASATGAWAQGGPAWPSRPIKIIVPVATGGIIDLLSRALADTVSPGFKFPVVVESKAGADHMIGIQNVARSEPDGYTWLSASVPFTVNPSLRLNPGYDPLKDFRPVSLLATSPNVLVVPTSVPANNLAEFIALAKSKPGKLSYANPGNGSSNHLGMELFKKETGLDILGIPYKGQPPAITDLLAGRLDAMLMSSSLSATYIKSGQLRPLAVVAPKRLASLPDVPTMAESGYPKVDVIPWFGILVPGKTPDEVVKTISDAVNTAMKSQDFLDKIAAIGATPYGPSSPADFEKLIRAETEKWPAVLEQAGIQKS